MKPANSAEIFNPEQYHIAEVLEILKQQNVYDVVFTQSQQVNSPRVSKATNNQLKNYNGNYITLNGKTILAMAGPTNDKELNALLHEFLNKERTIRTVIVLLKNEDTVRKYCVNYFHKGYPINCRDFDVVITDILIKENTVNSSTGIDYDAQCVLSDINVMSKMAEQRLPLKIFSLPIACGGTIIKSESTRKHGINYEKNAQYVNFLLESYQEWFKYGIAAVHCEHGSQRTALLALVFFMLDQFNKIFIVNNPHETVQNIIQLCGAIICQRELFRPSLSQFYAAIELTVKLKAAMVNLVIQNVSTNNDAMLAVEQDKKEAGLLVGVSQSDRISTTDLTGGRASHSTQHGETGSVSTTITKAFIDLSIWRQSQSAAVQTPLSVSPATTDQPTPSTAHVQLSTIK